MDLFVYTNKKASDILVELGTSIRGLSPGEAQKRLEKYGSNVVVTKETHWWQVLGRQFKSPFIYLLGFVIIATWHALLSIDKRLSYSILAQV